MAKRQVRVTKRREEQPKHVHRQRAELVESKPRPAEARFLPGLIRQGHPARRAALLRAGQRVLGNGAIQRLVSRWQHSHAAAAGLGVHRAAVQLQPAKPAKSPGKTVIKAVTTKTYRINARTLSGAVKAMNARNADEWGSCEWRPKVKLSFDRKTGLVIKATVTVTITVTMPDWPGASKLSQAAKTEWDRFYKALLAHEQGHVKLVQTKLAGLGEALVGKSTADAKAAYQEAVDALKEASDDYDTATDHGRKHGTIINTSIQ